MLFNLHWSKFFDVKRKRKEISWSQRLWLKVSRDIRTGTNVFLLNFWFCNSILFQLLIYNSVVTIWKVLIFNPCFFQVCMSKNPGYVESVEVKWVGKPLHSIVWSDCEEPKNVRKVWSECFIALQNWIRKVLFKFKAMAPYPFGNLKLPNSGDLIARLGITQLFALENVTQYLFGTKSFYVSIRFPLSVLCMDIRSYPYSNPFVFFRFYHR